MLRGDEKNLNIKGVLKKGKTRFFLKKIKFFWSKFLQTIYIKLFVLQLFMEKSKPKMANFEKN